MNENAMPAIDILDADLSNVSIEFPLLCKGTYDLKITEAEIKQQSNGPALAIAHENLDAAISTKNEAVAPGACKVFHRISLQPSGKATMQMVQGNIAQLLAAAGLKDKTLRQCMDAKLLEGKIVRAAVVVEPASTNEKTGKEYAESNKITRYLVKE